MKIPDLASLSSGTRQRLLSAIEQVKDRAFALITICGRADIAVRLGRDDDGEQLQAVVDEAMKQWQQAEAIKDMLK